MSIKSRNNNENIKKCHWGPSTSNWLTYVIAEMLQRKNVRAAANKKTTYNYHRKKIQALRTESRKPQPLRNVTKIEIKTQNVLQKLVQLRLVAQCKHKKEWKALKAKQRNWTKGDHVVKACKQKQESCVNNEEGQEDISQEET